MLIFLSYDVSIKKKFKFLLLKLYNEKHLPPIQIFLPAPLHRQLIDIIK